MIALLSIKPEFSDKIFSGDKWFEYRKVIFKKNVDKIIVYSTMPVGMIVGEFSIEDVIEGNPEKIWNLTKKNSGVDKPLYNKYFEGKSRGFAIKIGQTIRYEEPVNPRAIFNSFTAPQSFCYLSKKFAAMINNCLLHKSTDLANSKNNCPRSLEFKIKNDTFQSSAFQKAI